MLNSATTNDHYLFPEKNTLSFKNDVLEIKVSKRLAIAIFASVVLHLVVLVTRFIIIPEPPSASTPITIDVALAPKTPPREETPPSPPVPKVETPPPAPREKKTAKNQTKVLAVPKPNATSVPSIRQEPTVESTPSPRPSAPPTTPAPPTEIPPGMDMMAYINAKRAGRRAAGDAGQLNEDAQAKQRTPTRDEMRNEIIARNLKAEGQNGLFNILSKDERYARFSYRGWTNDYTNARQEIIDVDAGPNGNIEDAIITRMIQIIRQHYQEDFNWHSQRLGRVIVLSARPEDTEGLKDFLKRELFNIKPAQIPY